MPRSNPSGVSNSRANSVRFREKDLEDAGIHFQLSLRDAPAEICSLATRLCSLPEDIDRCRSFEELSLALASEPANHYDEGISRALVRAQEMTDMDILACSNQHERRWMMKVNEPMFQVFEDAVTSSSATVTADYEWSEGADIMEYRAASLHNPKPDLAYGLALVPNSLSRDPRQWNALSRKAVSAMSAHPAISLRYSPSMRQDIIFPAVVYEAKSDSNPILWAENQAAVGAARSLALLDDMARLSGVPSSRPVVAMIASAGTLWRFYLCTICRDFDSDTRIDVYPINPGLLIHSDTGRYRIQLLLQRLRLWLVEEHEHYVRQHLKAIWEHYLTITSHQERGADGAS